MEHYYQEKTPLSGYQHLSEDEHAEPFSALKLALWLSFVGLFGSAILVSFKGEINMAFTMPVAALLFMLLVLPLFCYRRSSFRNDRPSEIKLLREPIAPPAEKTTPNQDSNVVVLQPVRNKNGRVSYQRA